MSACFTSAVARQQPPAAERLGEMVPAPGERVDMFSDCRAEGLFAEVVAWWLRIGLGVR